jgi:hypothetical protein
MPPEEPPSLVFLVLFVLVLPRLRLLVILGFRLFPLVQAYVPRIDCDINLCILLSFVFLYRVMFFYMFSMCPFRPVLGPYLSYELHSIQIDEPCSF